MLFLRSREERRIIQFGETNERQVEGSGDCEDLLLELIVLHEIEGDGGMEQRAEDFESEGLELPQGHVFEVAFECFLVGGRLRQGGVPELEE